MLCVQETKVQDEHFPTEMITALGYPHMAFTGQKSYNGVAIFSRLPLSHIDCMDVLGNGDRRHISARLSNGLTIHNFYVPAGGDIPDPTLNPKFRDKLAFIDDTADFMAAEHGFRDRAVLAGDLNIAPLEHDVWSHKDLLKVVSHTPIETEGLLRIQQKGKWVDLMRQHVPAEKKLYTWWSYRARDWETSDRGRRLDHIWSTAGIAPACKKIEILKEARGWQQPSDHVPVTVKVTAAA